MIGIAMIVQTTWPSLGSVPTALGFGNWLMHTVLDPVFIALFFRVFMICLSAYLDPMPIFVSEPRRVRHFFLPDGSPRPAHADRLSPQTGYLARVAVNWCCVHVFSAHDGAP